MNLWTANQLIKLACFQVHCPNITYMLIQKSCIREKKVSYCFFIISWWHSSLDLWQYMLNSLSSPLPQPPTIDQVASIYNLKPNILSISSVLSNKSSTLKRCTNEIPSRYFLSSPVGTPSHQSVGGSCTYVEPFCAKNRVRNKKIKNIWSWRTPFTTHSLVLSLSP